MAALRRGLLVLGVCAVLVAAVLADDAAPASSIVIGLAKCADCTSKNMDAEAAFMGLQVAVKCLSAHGEYETKAVGEVDKAGEFAVPLDAALLREDGELKQDCFAQLHSAPGYPCPGQEPSRIVRPSSSSPDAADKKGFVAVAGKVHYSSKECASAFLCDPFHKKDLLHKKPALVVPHLKKKPIVIPHLHKKPVVIPHFHKKPVPVPVPEYKPPTSTPVHPHPKPAPEYKPPTPVYPHPAPIYHPPAADQKAALNPETDPQLFKKLLHKKPITIPHFHKKPIVVPPFHKKPAPVPEHKPPKPTPVVYTNPTPVKPHPSPIYHPPAADQTTALNPETDPQLFKKLLHKKPIVIPHFHKKPVPVPEYKPPTPTPVYTHPTPEPEHKPQTPIYHPPADQKMAQDPETDPQLFKKLLPFIKKNPFFKKFPPAAKEDTKP